MTLNSSTEWRKDVCGTALIFNGKIVGWVTSTNEGRYLAGLVGTPTKDKRSEPTYENAKHALLHEFFQADQVGVPA